MKIILVGSIKANRVQELSKTKRTATIKIRRWIAWTAVSEDFGVKAKIWSIGIRKNFSN